MGGPGAESQVSRWSGEAVAKALRAGGAKVTVYDVCNTHFILPAGMDIVFNIIHGTFGEDGAVQALFDKHGIPYTGEGEQGSRLAFDKILSKECFIKDRVPTANFEIIRRGERPKMQVPYVIKPPREGSAIGVHIIKENNEARINAALEDAFKYGETVLVEEFISGRELTVGILGNDILPIIEIKAKEGVYDYEHKYTKGGSEHLIPAPLEPLQTENIQKIALAAHRALGLEVYSRVDLILADDGSVVVLEVNTVPGMTETSLLPDAAAVFGLDFTALCARIIELSLAKKK